MPQLNLKISKTIEEKLEERKEKTSINKAGIAKHAIAKELGVLDDIKE